MISRSIRFALPDPLGPAPLVPVLLVPVLLMTAGCAGRGGDDAPSLLPRPVESRSDALPAYTPPPLVADPTLDTAIARNRRALGEARDQVAAVTRRVEAAASAARGAAVGSDRWIEAQSALAELDDRRAAVSAAVTDLDQLAIDRAATGLPDYPALEEARRTAAAELAEETQRIQRLEALSPRG